MADLISKDDLKRVLRRVPEWEVEGKALTRSFEFDDFQDAVDFVVGVSEVVADVNHHPDVNIRYNKVTLFLTTHSKGGITDADIEVAQMVDNLAD
jgi:4a-hydroxytetrahydrobiopterin dehydratase